MTIIFISILDEGIVEIRKKFNSHDGLLRADQDGVKTFLPNGLNGCPILQVHKSKSHREISIPSTFLQFPHQVGMKNITKCWKDFLYYSTTREIYCDHVYQF